MKLHKREDSLEKVKFSEEDNANMSLRIKLQNVFVRSTTPTFEVISVDVMCKPFQPLCTVDTSFSEGDGQSTDALEMLRPST